MSSQNLRKSLFNPAEMIELTSRVLDFTRGLTVLLIEAVRLSPGSALEYPELISSEDRI